ncbi:MAG: branched-chain amino acid ABC transporter substrate-binding protein [Elusimicrobia bacterium]|nr:branched-chain amino acid ABC transporter substrate-binding protein [Elusimicrobiota bacterium]
MFRQARLAAAVLSSLALAACSRVGDRPVRIALAAPLTGDMGTEGQGLFRAVTMAIEEANATKEYPYRIELAAYDDRSDPRQAVDVAHLITLDPRIVAVVGHYNSGCCITAARVYAQAGMAMVTPSATNPEVTVQQTRPDWTWPRVVFRLVPTDDAQGAYAAGFVRRKLGKRSVSILHDKTAYGRDLTGEFKKVFVRLGGKVLSEDEVDAGQKDFKKALAAVKAANPEAVYFGGVYTEAGLLVRQMRSLGIKAAFISGDGAKTPGFFDVAKEASEGAYLSMVGVPVEVLPGAQGFMDKYRQRWMTSGEGIKPFDHFGYEAARIALGAIARAGPERARIVEDIRTRPHQSLLGPMVFDAKGDSQNRTVTMTQARFKERVFDVIR